MTLADPLLATTGTAADALPCAQATSRTAAALGATEPAADGVAVSASGHAAEAGTSHAAGAADGAAGAG